MGIFGQAFCPGPVVCNTAFCSLQNVLVLDQPCLSVLHLVLLLEVSSIRPALLESVRTSLGQVCSGYRAEQALHLLFLVSAGKTVSMSCTAWAHRRAKCRRLCYPQIIDTRAALPEPGLWVQPNRRDLWCLAQGNCTNLFLLLVTTKFEGNCKNGWRDKNGSFCVCKLGKNGSHVIVPYFL